MTVSVTSRPSHRGHCSMFFGITFPALALRGSSGFSAGGTTWRVIICLLVPLRVDRPVAGRLAYPRRKMRPGHQVSRRPDV